MDDLLTVKEAAALLGVNASTVYQMIDEGRLPARVVLGRRAVLRADALAYLERVRPDGQQPTGRPKGSRDREPRRG